MDAKEFVRVNGIEEALEIVEGWVKRDFNDSYHIADKAYCNLPFEPSDSCGTLCLFDLKRLVEAHDLVEYYGGVNGAKRELDSIAEADSMYSRKENGILFHKILKAIVDVEACQ